MQTLPWTCIFIYKSNVVLGTDVPVQFNIIYTNVGYVFLQAFRVTDPNPFNTHKPPTAPTMLQNI